MRAGIVGAGLAGSLLAWRLAQAAPRWRLDVMAGRPVASGAPPGPDATAASGGAVRCYEAEPRQRRLAVLSMVELLASDTLRAWAGYAPAAAVCLTRDPGAVAAAAAEIEDHLPGSADRPSVEELARSGWAGLTGDEAAIREHRAGSISPGRLRDAVLADAGGRIAIHRGPVTSVRAGTGGLVECVVGGEAREFDLLILAAGAWTGALLRDSGLGGGGYRVKSIQYSVFGTGAWRPPQFVDEITGVFGLPLAGRELLLGVPTDEWGVNPDRPPTTPGWQRLAIDRARARFPALTLGPVVRQVGSADCYGDPPFLSLQRVGDDDQPLFTFSGGAGGSAKTALAASALAASHLATLGHAVTADSSSTERG